jgi:hypothetical protein
VGAAAVVIPVLPVTAAHATAYRYWTYWHAAPGSSSWAFAGGGPSYRPSDGAVEGWRFAVSQGTTSAPQPRTDPAKAYTSTCRQRTPADGMKLVAVVLDYGTAADAPKGEKPPHGVVAACVEIPKNGNGFDVLREADVTVRQDAGLICGLNGYPRTECAPAVTATPTATAKPMPTPTKPSPAPSPAKSHSSTPPDRSPSSSGATTHSVTATPTGSASDLASVAASSRSAAATATAASESSPSASASPSAVAEAAPSLVVGDVAADSDGGGSPWALIVGGAVLVLILGAAGLRARWNR